MTHINGFPVLSAEEAVATIQNGDTVSFSGFTPAGAAKAVPRALTVRARSEHAEGRPFRVRVLTGASSGNVIDDELAQAEAISWRAPYQTGRELRKRIDAQEVEYVDMHLSHLPQMVLNGFFGRIDLAVVEASEITPDGRVYLTTSIGASPTYLRHADRVVIECNRRHSMRLRELADIFIVPRPPHRDPIYIYDPLTRIGAPYATVDPRKVIGIVENDEADHVTEFTPPDAVSARIAEHLVRFLADEMRMGRIPPAFLPVQAGVGNVSNGVMAGLGRNPDIPAFNMYSEVFQNSLVDLMMENRVLGASATSLSVTTEQLDRILDNMDFFNRRIVLRPQEISNHPGVIRRLGVIALNTALEMDIYGNVNSSHVGGTRIMNGIGGSGDFARNGHLVIFMAPSTAKNGRISSVVPMCPHIDSNEHSVQVLVTEQGLADLRGLGPVQRAKKIIANCAHPSYRDYLEKYLRESPSGHIPHDLRRCFELHCNFMETGSMLPDADTSRL